MQTQTVQSWFQRLREDFPLYCRTNIRIKTKAAKLSMFELNKMQQKLWSFFLEDLLAGRPIRWYVIKGRQMGSTVFFTALVYWLTTLWANKSAVVVAQDEVAATGLGSKIQGYYMRSEAMLKPAVRIMNRKQIHFGNSLEQVLKTGDVGLDSVIDTFSIDTENLGRSKTYQIALLTEFSMYPFVVGDVKDKMDSLLNTIADDPETKVILETTPKGDNYAKQVWDDNENGFRKIFISWVAMEDYRIEILPSEYFDLSEVKDSKYGDEFEERNKIINQINYWHPEINTKAEIEHEVYCRIAWRRYQIDKKLSGDKTKFKQEYPTSIQDAFAYSADSVFPIERIVEMSNFLESQKIKSSNFRYHHDDEVKDQTKKFYEARYGHLSIYEAPIPGCVYVIGADGAQGIPKGDDSSAYVLRLPELEEVACFSDIIIPEHFAGVLNYLGLLYNKALIGCEINDKGGYAAVEKLVNVYHYPNLYYKLNPLSTKVETNIRWGWITNPETRQIMINDLTVLLNNGDIFIKSKKLLSQLISFVMINGKAQAEPGKHDDLVIAAMIAVQMVRQAHIPREPIKPKTPPKFSFEWHMQNMGKTKNSREKFQRRSY